MPRKTTKKIQKVEVLSPVIPDDENYSDAVKKASFLLDFDVRVENDIEEMKKYMEDVVSSLNRTFIRQKNLVKKEIRSMKVVDFLKMGGDLNTLDFTETINPLIEDPDISFQVSAPNDDTLKEPLPLIRKSTRKRTGQIPESPLVQDAPLVKGKPRKAVNSKIKPQLNAPLIVPKFDPRKPIGLAREPKRGETLISLAGSPVIQSLTSDPASESICAIYLNKQQTILGGTMFDTTMSPNSLMTSRERLQQVMGAITSRLEDLDSQLVAQQSKLN